MTRSHESRTTKDDHPDENIDHGSLESSTVDDQHVKRIAEMLKSSVNDY